MNIKTIRNEKGKLKLHWLIAKLRRLSRLSCALVDFYFLSRCRRDMRASISLDSFSI